MTSNVVLVAAVAFGAGALTSAAVVILIMREQQRAMYQRAMFTGAAAGFMACSVIGGNKHKNIADVFKDITKIT